MRGRQGVFLGGVGGGDIHGMCAFAEAIGGGVAARGGPGAPCVGEVAGVSAAQGGCEGGLRSLQSSILMQTILK